jgi:drug/metabolite transporter (DMT)-like permease
MNPSGTAAGLGLLSAASWGGSDFVGGLGARRAPTLLVVASGHFITLLVLLAICLGTHLALPARHDLLFAAVGGFEGAVGLALFYRALAMGAMGITAALTGLLTALAPVLFSLFHDGLPTLLTLVGLTMGLAAIWLITHFPATNESGQKAANHRVPHPFRALGEKGGRPQRSTRPALQESTNTESKPAATPPAALLLGALAGLAFGAQLIFFKLAAGGNILWVLTSTRAAGVTAMLLVLLVMPPTRPWRGFWLFGILAGSLDTLGNLFYIQTTRHGRLDVAAMVCSLYPAGTILLAALVLGEWPAPRQFAGIALALAAVALLSV